MMRKAARVRLTLLGLAILAAAAPASAQETITFVSRTGDVYKQLVAEFEAQNPDIKVDMSVLTGSWADQAEKIVARQVAGVPYDVIYMATEGSQALSSAGALMPLDNWLASDPDLQDYKKDVAPALFHMFQYQGRQYQLPFEWNNMVVYYNTMLFEKAGVARPADDWSWNDYLAIGRKLTVRDGSGKVVQYGSAPYGGWYFGDMPWVFTAGGTLLNAGWTEARADAEGVVQALQMVQDMRWRDQIAPPPGVGGFADLANNLGMWGAGRWPVGLAYQPQKFSNYDIQLWPMLKQHATVLGGGAWGVSPGTKHLDAAKKLVKFLVSKHAFEAATASGDSMPSRLSVAFSGAVSGVPPAHYKVYIDALDNAPAVPAPPAYPQLERIWANYSAQVSENKITPQDAAYKMQTEMAAALKG